MRMCVYVLTWPAIDAGTSLIAYVHVHLCVDMVCNSFWHQKDGHHEGEEFH